jgi:hypothetical protein
VGSVAGTIINFIQILLIDVLKFGQFRFMDYAGIMVYGRRFHTFVENLFAFFIQVGFSASLGVLFVLLLDGVSTKNLFLKGMYFGVFVWYFIFALVLLYKVPYLLVLTFEGGVENFLSSIIFGAVLAVAFRILYQKNWE